VLAESNQRSAALGSSMASLQEESQALMMELVQRKLELAQLSEREIICRRELHKAKETNMRLASKMTKLELQLYESRKR